MESLDDNGSSKIKILSLDTQARLAVLAQYGDTEARDRLIRTNIGQVISIAKGYVNRGLPLRELVHIGNQGFIPGIRTFDPIKGNFLTHVTYWIRQGMSASLGDQSPIRIPTNRLAAWNRIGKKVDILRKELEREPNAVEISRRFDLPANEVEEYLEKSHWLSSLDAPVPYSGKHKDGKNNTLSDLLQDHRILLPDRETFQNILKEGVRKSLRHLPRRERTIIECRYELNGKPCLSYVQLGKKFHISNERARNIEKKLLKKELKGLLRKYRD